MTNHQRSLVQGIEQRNRVDVYPSQDEVRFLVDLIRQLEGRLGIIERDLMGLLRKPIDVRDCETSCQTTEETTPRQGDVSAGSGEESKDEVPEHSQDRERGEGAESQHVPQTA